MFGKPTAGFRQLGASLEPDTMDLGISRTPVDRFFVCSAGAPAEIAPGDWELHIDGDAAPHPLALSLADLRDLPQSRVDAWLECAGNGRQMFTKAGGHAVSEDAIDTAWTLGGMGMATWSGPSLASVLALAGIDDSAAFIGPMGLDVENPEGEPVRMSLPMDKAMHPDTLVALDMNEAPLVQAHGAPARLLVPGWVGAYSVKWLGRLEISSAWISSWRADEYYVHRTADGTVLGPATSHPVKSCLALDWPASTSPGTQTITGYARAAGTPISRVAWSLDDGPWQDAVLTGPNEDWSWAPFSFEWDAAPGEHQIRTQAWDATGQTQPADLDFHPNTILWNAITRHPIAVGPSPITLAE